MFSTQVLEAYKKARNRLIISDYDGTLTTLQSLPQLASPPTAVTNVLDSLCKDLKNRLFIISGRCTFFVFLPNWFLYREGAVSEHICQNTGVLDMVEDSCAWNRVIRDIEFDRSTGVGGN